MLPPPRYHHTATPFEQSKVLIFGGIGEKSRLNDIYILETGRGHFSFAESNLD